MPHILRKEGKVNLAFIDHMINFYIKYFISYLGLTIVDSDLEWFIKVLISGFLALIFSIGAFEYKKWRNKDSKNKTE